MTHRAADPVASGKQYTVLDVERRPAQSLQQFTGQNVRFTADDGTQTVALAGNGTLIDDHVRFHEHNADTGRDVRLWNIHGRSADGGFVAEPLGNA